MGDKPLAIDYEIAHKTTGRMRIRVPQIKENPAYASQLEQLIVSIPGVTDVRINIPAFSAIVSYKPNAISEEAMVRQLHDSIQQAGGVDPASVPGPDAAKLETEPPDSIPETKGTESPAPEAIEPPVNDGTVAEPEESVPPAEVAEANLENEEIPIPSEVEDSISGSVEEETPPTAEMEETEPNDSETVVNSSTVEEHPVVGESEPEPPEEPQGESQEQSEGEPSEESEEEFDGESEEESEGESEGESSEPKKPKPRRTRKGKRKAN